MKEYVKKWIDAYYKRWGSPTDPHEFEDINKVVASEVVGGSILDVGCGMGHLYHYVKDMPLKYIGLDAHIPFIDTAKEIFDDVTFIEGDMFDLSSAPVCDTVTCIRTLGQDWWVNNKYNYREISEEKDDTPQNMDYHTAVLQLWSRANKRLIMSCPYERPKTLDIILSIVTPLGSVRHSSMEFPELGVKCSFTIIVVDRQ